MALGCLGSWTTACKRPCVLVQFAVFRVLWRGVGQWRSCYAAYVLAASCCYVTDGVGFGVGWDNNVHVKLRSACTKTFMWRCVCTCCYAVYFWTKKSIAWANSWCGVKVSSKEMMTRLVRLLKKQQGWKVSSKKGNSLRSSKAMKNCFPQKQ